MSGAPTFGDAVLRIAPDQIQIPERLGLYFPDKAAALGRMMAVNGQRTPLTVRKSGPRAVLPWTLVVGRHRLGGALLEELGTVSFDDVFAESYATAPIGRATSEQMRMALLPAENVRVNRQTGEIGLYGNRWWAPFCGELRGQVVTVRFDPGDLKRPAHLYDLAGRYLGEVENWQDRGFDDIAEAKGAARLNAEYRKSARAVLDAERRLSAAEVALIQRQIGGEADPLPEPAVVRPHRHHGQVAALKVAAAPQARAQSEARVFAGLALRVVGEDD